MGAQLWPVVVALLVLATANSDAGSCKPAGCSTTGGNGIFKYEAGNTYVYHLEGKSLADLPEQQGDAVKVELSSKVEIHVGADCSNTIQLKEVAVTGPTAKKYGNLKELEAHAARFTFNDGVVGDELCADADDTNAALNIKRAVISLLQVATPQSTGSATKHETDIFGVCPTSFTISNQGGGTAHVTKSRNLNKCAHRESLRQRILSTPYVTDSQFQSSPLLQSSLEVDQTVKAGVLQSAESRESYLFRPFANQGAGAKTVVTTKLTFVSKSAGSPHVVSGNAARSLIFDAPHGDAVINSNSASIVAAMHKAKDSMPDQASASAATEFRHLVEVFRQSSKNDLLTVYGQVKAGAGFADKVSARKVYLDSLFRAGTGDSVQVAIELLKSNEITGDIAKLWYASFGFVRHATLPTLTAAAALLDGADVPKAAYLGIGSLAAQYCAEHECANAKPVAELLAKLAKPIAGGCHCANHQEENKIIAALKGIENVRFIDEATSELLRICASDVTVASRVRVSALETFRASPCQPQLKKTALELLRNTNEDSEIRIKAYLAAVPCPCNKCAIALKELLDNEPVNQVGSFIVSHLRNIRASSNPDKANAKAILGGIRSAKRFPEDVRRYSHNREISYFLDALNIGASAERTVIYSQQSYLPRSTSLNITTEIFGHSFNLLELGSRAENLDRIVEAYFGPRGYFKTHDAEELIKSGKVTLKGLREKLEERAKKSFGRSKRSVPVDKLEAFRNSVALVNDRQNIEVDLNLKVFGSNVGGLNYHGNAKDLSPDSVIDKIFDCLDKGIDKAKNYDYHVKHHGIFLDTELAYPTGLGFPLKLAVTGTAVLHVDANGKVDLPAIFKDPKNIHVKAELLASAVVEVIGTLTVDAYAVRSGLKVSATLHSATGLNVDLKSVDGAGFDVSVGLPVKKQEIVNFKTDVLVTVQERGQTEDDKALPITCKRKEYRGCFDQLSPLVGLTFCGDVAVPFDGIATKAAFFPLNGPSRLLVTIESDDVTSYRFRGVANVKDPDHKSLELLIDTPNSKTNRKLELVLAANRKPQKELRITLVSPYKQASAELVRTETDKEQSLTGKLVNDGAEYVVKVGVEITGGASQKTYKPLLEYSTPAGGKGGKKGKKSNKLDYNVEGSVVVDTAGDSRKFTFNNVALSAPAGKVEVTGWVALDKTSVSSDLKVARGADSVVVKGKAEKLGPAQFKVDGQVQASNYPDLGVAVKWDYNRGKDELDTTLVLVHGKDLTSTQSRLTAHALAKYHIESRKDFDISGKATVAYPAIGIEGKLEAAATPKSVSYKLLGTYEKNKIKSELSAKRNTNAPGDYDVEFETKVLESGIKITSKRDIVNPDESKFTNCVELSPGGKYELNADVTCKRQDGSILSKIVAEGKIPSKTEAYKLDAGIELTPSLFATHTKASLGAVDWVDIDVKLNKAPNPSGNAKVIVKNNIDGSGQFKYLNGVGSLTATVDLKKLDRKIKASGDLAVTGTKHVGNLDVYLNHDKDPSKKIHVSTTTDVSSHSIDSKNTAVLNEWKTELNFKGDLDGKFNDGHLITSGDLTLPNHRVLTYKIDRVAHLSQGVGNMLGSAEFTSAEKKGATPLAIALKARADSLNLKRGLLDVEYDLLIKNPVGKEVNYHVLAKSLPADDKHCVEFKGLIKGTNFELAPLVHVKADVGKADLTYTVKLDLAKDASLDLTGNIHRSIENKPYQGDVNLELNLPTGELKNIKLVKSWEFQRGHDDVLCSLKASLATTCNNEKTVKAEVEASGTKQAGNGKLTVTLPNDAAPRILQASYKADKSSGVKREVAVTLTHADKEVHVDVAVEVPESKDTILVTVGARTPFEKVRKLDVVFKGARNEKLVQTDTTIVRDDKKTIIATKYGLEPRHPIVEVSVEYPSGKKTVVSFNFVKKDSAEGEYSGALALEHGENALAAKLDARAPSVHDFQITLDLDSAKLKLNKIHLVLANKPAKGGKTVTVTATEDGQSLVTGKLDYRSEDGSNGVLYEATGNLKVRGESKAAKISLKRNIIAAAGENGVEVTLITQLGDRSLEADYKRTNKGFLLAANLCKDKGACGEAKYDLKYSLDGTELETNVDVVLNLVGVGLPTDIEFKRTVKRVSKHFSINTVLTSKKKELYRSALDITDKAASWTISTPQREVCVDSVYALTVDPGSSGKHVTLKIDANAWLDKKREPANKASFSVDHDYLRSDTGVTVVSESRFAHPALGKDLVLKGKTVIGGRNIIDSVVEIDVFAKKGQKIVIDTKVVKNVIAEGYNFTAVVDIKSKGQNLDIVFDSHLAGSSHVCGIGSVLTYTDKAVKKDLGFGYQASLGKLAIFVKSPSAVILEVDVAASLKEHSFTALVDVVGSKAVIAEAHVDKEHKLITAIYKRDTPERKISGEYYLDVTNKAIARSDWIQGAEKKELYNVVVSWSKESKPQVSYSLDNIKALIEYLRKNLEKSVAEVKTVSQALASEASTEVTDVLEGLKKAQPNLKSLVASYQTQLEAIKSEITGDKTVQEVSELLKGIAEPAQEFVARITEIAAKIAEKAVAFFEKLSETLLNSLKKVVPTISQSLNKIFHIVVDISSTLTNQALVALQNLVELIKRHEAEFQQVAKVVAEIGHDLVQIVGRSVKEVYREIRDFLVVVSDQLKALPLIGMVQERIVELKQQIKEYALPDQLFETLHELTNGLKETLPTEELKDFVNSLATYVEKVLKKQKVDDLAELRAIYSKLVAAVRSVIVLVRAEVGAKEAQNLVPSSWPQLKNLYSLPIWASVHLSPLALLRSDDLPSLKQLYYTYRPTLNPLDYVPPFKASGILIDTSHFFTFDRRHFTFRGTCSYILAQDVVNGNFTLVLNLDKGKFKSLQLTSGADTVEVLASQALLLNGKPHEFPLHVNDNVHAWRRYDSVNIATQAGAKVKLDMDHHFAAFHVSGFYHGQLRGLLGDSNNEGFDDFRLPSGVVSTDVAEFGNAYQVGGGKCAPGTSVSHDHHGHHEAECTQLFSANSPLRSAFPIIDATAFREACDHLVSETTSKKQEYACRIAAAYVATARDQYNFINVPSACATCKIAEKNVPLGETVSVKGPHQSADIVLVVEQVTNNAEVYKELVVPLVAALTSDLKAKGINDVDISLLGYGHPNNKWPQHYTTGGKLAFDGKVKLEFGDLEKLPAEPTTRLEKWQMLKHNVRVELGLTKLRSALTEASEYPFRAGAAKSVIIVTGSTCETSIVPLGFQKLRFLLAKRALQNNGINVHTVSALDGFNVAGNKDAKQLKQIVGFDSHTVYSLSDAKKKSLEGNDDLRKDVQYKPDVCVELAQSTNGATFYAGNFIDGKASARKQFLQVLSKRVIDSLVGEFTEDCTCALEHGIHAQPSCKLTGRKESEPLIAAKGKKSKN